MARRSSIGAYYKNGGAELDPRQGIANERLAREKNLTDKLSEDRRARLT